MAFLSRPGLALVLVLFASLVGADEAATYAPSRVKVEDPSSPVALVSWLPGIEPADSFRVYGGTGAGLVLLLDTAGTAAPFSLAALVPSGYDAYAVTGVRAGVESPPVFGSATTCSIYVETRPPGVGLEDCLPGKTHGWRMRQGPG